MQSPQTLTRRIVPALAVTLVATLVLGAVVVTADAATDDTPLLPESFAVAAPRQGDAWRYNVTLGGEWTFGLEDTVKVDSELPFGTFQWAGPASVRGGDGLLHDVNRYHAEVLTYEPLYVEEVDLDEERDFSEGAEDPTGHDEDEDDVELGPAESPYWTLGNASGWVRAGGRDIVSRGVMESEGYNNTNYGFTPPPLDLGVGAYYEEGIFAFGFVEYPVDEVPCLAFNPLQGNNVSTVGEVRLFDACSLGGEFLTIPEDLAFRAASVETVQGVQAIRYDASLNGTYSAWFTPSVPYPVRFAFSLPSERPDLLEEGDRDAPGARSAVLEMVGFAAGANEFDTVDDPADLDAAPSLLQAPPMMQDGTRLGPDEAGMSHPFPLSVAFREALNATNFESLETYLGGHEGIYMAAAQYIEDGRAMAGPTAMSGHSRTWLIGLTYGNPDDVFGFAATQTTYETYMPVLVRDQVREPLYSFDPYYGPMFQWEDAPSLDKVPLTLATAKSLSDRWAAFDGSGQGEANNWGFRVGCAERDEGEPCRVVTEYLVGYNRANQDGMFNTPGMNPFALPGDPYGSEMHVWVQREIAFDGDGVASAMLVFDERFYRSSADDSPIGDGEDIPDIDPVADPGYTVNSAAVSGIPSPATKWIPEPKQAAGIGFMGLVVGALYWIWPKLGLIGLFSRLERGELLDHPARAKLVQIVEAQPGIHFHDLAAKAELANGTAVHHLRKLSDSGHLNVRRSGRYTCYFPGGRVDPGAAAAAPLLKSEGAKQVLDAIKGKPGMSNLEVAQATGLQPSTVNYHVQRLSQAGLVAALRDGRMVRLHPGIRIGSVGGDGTPSAGAAA